MDARDRTIRNGIIIGGRIWRRRGTSQTADNVDGGVSLKSVNEASRVEGVARRKAMCSGCP